MQAESASYRAWVREKTLRRFRMGNGLLVEVRRKAMNSGTVSTYINGFCVSSYCPDYFGEEKLRVELKKIKTHPDYEGETGRKKLLSEIRARRKQLREQWRQLGIAVRAADGQIRSVTNAR